MTRDTATTIVEFIGFLTFVIGIAAVFGYGWAMIVTGATTVAAGYYLSQPPPNRDRNHR